MGVNTTIGTEINAYAFTKNSNNQKKITEINKAINAMHNDGTLSFLSMKWFDIETTTK